jgi:hypothetical protein
LSSTSILGDSWHHHRIPPVIATVVRRVGGSRRRSTRLAPQLRGTVPPRVVDELVRRGWHVHRIGSAAYVHAPDGPIHLIFGVWRRRSTRPAWAIRLGHASAGYIRRLERAAREQRWRRQRRDPAGRFGARLPWTRWPTPELYSWDPAGPSVAEQIEAQERVTRWRAGLVGDVGELELRALDGDR